MDTAGLEALLEGSAESPSLDFKEAMSWKKDALVRDILAMANVQDGGTIVIGVRETEQGAFERQGISEEQRQTYDADAMKDQVSPYADPHVEFGVSFPADNAGLLYAVIEVRPFSELPVICGKSGSEVKEGDIYYRSADRRPASARVSSSNDMRDIIERAIARRHAKLMQLGLIAAQAPEQLAKEAQDRAALDAELGGL